MVEFWRFGCRSPLNRVQVVQVSNGTVIPFVMILPGIVVSPGITFDDIMVIFLLHLLLFFTKNDSDGFEEGSNQCSCTAEHGKEDMDTLP